MLTEALKTGYKISLKVFKSVYFLFHLLAIQQQLYFYTFLLYTKKKKEKKRNRKCALIKLSTSASVAESNI